MRMAQNEMANVNYEAKNVLCVSVKTIVFINIALYLLLFAGFLYYTVTGKAKVNSAEFFFTFALMFSSFAMCTAHCIMHIGVLLKRAEYIFPCIIMTLPTCFILLAYLFYIKKHQILTYLFSVCLIYMVLSWYPLYVFYKQFLSTSANASEPSAPMEDQTLNPTVDLVGYGFRPLPTVVPDFPNAVPPHTAIDNCQSPPSYESAMAVGH